MIAGHKKTGSIGRFFGFRELVATPVCCYVVPEGDQKDLYFNMATGCFFALGYMLGYTFLSAIRIVT